jgi:hypothetical protein
MVESTKAALFDAHETTNAAHKAVNSTFFTKTSYVILKENIVNATIVS